MTRRADIVSALRKNPTAFADRLGFPLLTDLHRDWCREMVFGKSDHTLQAHKTREGRGVQKWQTSKI